MQSKKGRKAGKEKEKRVSTGLMNDVQDYLGGYGEDYGQMTDEMMLSNGIEPVKKDKKDKKSNKKKTKKEKKSKKSSKTKVNEEKGAPKAKQVTISAQEELIPSLPTVTIEDTDEPVMEYEEGIVREAGEGAAADDQNMSPLRGARSRDSIDAHPSFESLLDDDEEEIDREREAGEGEEQDGATPPEETEHYTEAVRRLQEANQEYEEQHFGKVTIAKSILLISITIHFSVKLLNTRSLVYHMYIHVDLLAFFCKNIHDLKLCASKCMHETLSL